MEDYQAEKRGDEFSNDMDIGPYVPGNVEKHEVLPNAFAEAPYCVSAVVIHGLGCAKADLIEMTRSLGRDSVNNLSKSYWRCHDSSCSKREKGVIEV